MRKLFIAALAVLSFGLANAQESGFKAGVHLGMPIGDYSDLLGLNYGVDAAYMFDVAEGFKVGATAGYSIYSGKSVTETFFDETFTFEFPDLKLFTIGATAQYSFTESIFGGVDLGYAIPSEGDGALYYMPKFGYQAESFEVYLGYKGVAFEGTALTSLQLGFNYKF